MTNTTHCTAWKLGMLSILVVVFILFTSTPAVAFSGTVKCTDGAPIPWAFIGFLSPDFQFLGATFTDTEGAFAVDGSIPSGFLFVQPYAPVNAEGLGIYPYEPRMYQLNGEDTADVRLPATGALVLKAYDSDGNLMRWGDFLSKGTLGGQFMYSTNLDDELRPAACWPVYDEEARALGAPQEAGLPALVIEPGQSRALNVMFWEVPGYGKLLLKADNGGDGYEPSAAGQCLVLELNVELAVTAVADLYRRSVDFPEAATPGIEALYTALDSAIAQSDPVVRAAQADQVLASALELRDQLELEAAQTAIPLVRRGKVVVIVMDKSRNRIPGAQVKIEQRSHSFKFGIFDGDQFNETAFQAARDAGFEMATMLFGWAWTEKEPNVMLEPELIDQYYGISELKDMGFDLKAHGVVWMQDGVLPERAYSMDWPDVQAENLDHQDDLIEAFAGQIDLWESVNEPAFTNVVGMPRNAMSNLVALAASNIKAHAGLGTLVNSGHETDYGKKYFYYGLDNQPVDSFALTYSEALKEAEATGCLNEVENVGLQFYPGFKLSEQFNYLEGPAMTPSWFVDMVSRYEQFNRPIHITEFSLPSFQGADWNNGYWREPWNETTQADYAEAMFTLAFANLNIDSITWWDIDDVNEAVLGGGLIDEYGRTKEAYSRIQGLIDSWTTEVNRTTNLKGRAVTKAYAGEYDVTITLPNGEVIERQISVEEGVSTRLTLKVDLTLEVAL